MHQILILNGPNLNQLGTREPKVYGDLSLEKIKSLTDKLLIHESVELTWKETSYEGQLIDWIHEAKNYKGLVINPGGLSHTSVSLMDAMSLFGGTVIEVHISNVYKRETYRQQMLTAKSANARRSRPMLAFLRPPISAL